MECHLWKNSVGKSEILYVICRYSFMLHPKKFAPCLNPSPTWAILFVICLISLMLCAHSVYVEKWFVQFSSMNNLIHVGYFMRVRSQAKVMSKNNSIIISTKGQKVNLLMQHIILSMNACLWQCNIANWMQQKLTECAIFARVINGLKQANGFLDTT